MCEQNQEKAPELNSGLARSPPCQLPVGCSMKSFGLSLRPRLGLSHKEKQSLYTGLETWPKAAGAKPSVSSRTPLLSLRLQ